MPTETKEVSIAEQLAHLSDGLESLNHSTAGLVEVFPHEFKEVVEHGANKLLDDTVLALLKRHGQYDSLLTELTRREEQMIIGAMNAAFQRVHQVLKSSKTRTFHISDPISSTHKFINPDSGEHSGVALHISKQGTISYKVSFLNDHCLTISLDKDGLKVGSTDAEENLDSKVGHFLASAGTASGSIVHDITRALFEHENIFTDIAHNFEAQVKARIVKASELEEFLHQSRLNQAVQSLA